MSSNKIERGPSYNVSRRFRRSPRSQAKQETLPERSGLHFRVGAQFSRAKTARNFAHLCAQHQIRILNFESARAAVPTLASRKVSLPLLWPAKSRSLPPKFGLSPYRPPEGCARGFGSDHRWEPCKPPMCSVRTVRLIPPSCTLHRHFNVSAENSSSCCAFLISGQFSYVNGD